MQTYCEELLREAIANEMASQRLAEDEVKHGAFEALDAIANDLEYLAEWTASVAPRTPRSLAMSNNIATTAEPDTITEEPDVQKTHHAESATVPRPKSLPPSSSAAIDVVLRHAAMLGDDPSSLLATLRRGETLDPDTARELLQALIDLERDFRDASHLERRLSYALHRLAFEGQVLLTDAWPGLATDPGTVETLRLVQEAVDRVLSGEDIRYYAERSESEPETEESF